MNNTRRTLTCVVLALAMGSALTACSAGANGGQEQSSPTGATATEAPPEAPTDQTQPADPPAASTTLDVWIMGEGGPTFDSLTDAFTAETGIEVKVESIPWGNVNDKLTTAVASGQGPDVVQVGISLLQTFDDAGVLTDLSELVGAYPELAAENFPAGVAPQALDAAGRTMSIPWVSDTRILFYRADLLAEAGYDQPPADWAEMETAAAKLAERGADQYGYYIPLWDNTLILQYVWQQGSDIIGADGKLNFDSPEFEAALDHYLAFFDAGAAPAATDFDQVQGFVTGTAPMTVSGPYLVPSIADAGPDLGEDWTVAPLPAGSKARTSLFAGSNLAVWEGTDQLDGAVQLIAFMSKPAIQVAWFEAMNELPTNTEALAQLTAQGDPKVAVYVEQLADAKVVPQIPGWDLIANELTNALTAIVTGTADRDSAMAEFYTKAAEIQSNYE